MQCNKLIYYRHLGLNKHLDDTWYVMVYLLIPLVDDDDDDDDDDAVNNYREWVPSGNIIGHA